MKQLLHIITLLLFIIHTQSVGIIWGAYFVFSDDIAANYCVNPDIPTCHGKCHINKVVSQKDHPDEHPIVISLDPLSPFLPVLQGAGAEFSRSHITYYILSVDDITEGFGADIDHPPSPLS